MRNLILAACLALGGLGAGAGCSAGAYYDHGPGLYVSSAPPAPYYETVGTAPYHDAVWINGHWYWTGNRYVWNRGYWTHTRPGYVWAPHRYVRHGARYQYYAGHWVRVR